MARAENNKTKGPGLARGPALIIGAALLAIGLVAIIKHSAFLSFSSNFPDGKATGGKFLGLFEVNGWTLWLIMVCGGLLLFGSAQHLLAKTMSLIVGLVLGAAAVIALISGDILGIGAANFWTWLGLAVAAVILLLNVFAPRVKRDKQSVTASERAQRRQAVMGSGDQQTRSANGEDEPAARRI